MTNKKWVNLIAKEFNCSNSMAKNMLHTMYRAYEILSANKNVWREQKEKENQERRFIEYCEQCDSDDYDF